MLHCCSSSRHQSIYSSIAGYTVVSASSSSSAYIFRRRNQPYTSQDTQFGVIHPKSHRPLTDIILTILIHIFIAIRPLSLLGVITIIVLSFLRGQTASYSSFNDIRYGSSTCTSSTSRWYKWRPMVSFRLYPVHVKAYSVHSLYPVLDVTMPVAERAWVPSIWSRYSSCDNERYKFQVHALPMAPSTTT